MFAPKKLYTLKITNRALTFSINSPSNCCCCGCSNPEEYYPVLIQWNNYRGQDIITNKAHLSFPICRKCHAWAKSEENRRIFILYCLLAIPATIIFIIYGVISLLRSDIATTTICLFLSFIFLAKLGTLKKSLARPTAKPFDVCYFKPVVYLGCNNNIHSFQLSNPHFYERIKQVNKTSPQPVNSNNEGDGALEAKILALLNHDRQAAKRLLQNAQAKNPGKTYSWYLQKVLLDLERDRRI